MPTRRGPRRRGRPELRRTVTWFLALSLLAVVVVSAAAVAWSVSVARAQAVITAAESGRAIANGLVAPLCTDELRAGDRDAIDALDRVVRNRMRDGSIVRVKVWDPDGRILYSDVLDLIGRTYPLADDDRELLGTDRAVAEISTLDRRENEFEQPSGRLVETYAGIRDADGRPLLFEAYFPANRLDADARAIAWRLTPAALATIVALQLLQLPLATVLARRLDHAHREHNRLLEHAVTASELERRRIARDLHDGVIQDLAGVGYTLDAISDRLDGVPDGVRDRILRAAAIIQRDVRALRQTMVDIHPPDLSPATLEAALADLMMPLREAGTGCRLDVEDVDGIDHLVIQALYRAARELLHNAARHARASAVRVAVAVDGSTVVLTVVDDGVGLGGPGSDEGGGEGGGEAGADDGGGGPLEPPAQAGHLGLRLLREALRDIGGDLVLTTTPGGGLTARAWLPLT